MKIIFDSSFLLECAERKRDPFSEVERLVEEKGELVVPKPALLEIESLAAAGGKKALRAKIILEMISKRKTKVEATITVKADDAARELAEKSENAIVCSNDYALRKSLRKKARFICLSNGKISWC